MESVETKAEEFTELTTADIERYVKNGWRICDISTEQQVENGFKYIVLINPNRPE